MQRLTAIANVAQLRKTELDVCFSSVSTRPGRGH